MKLITATERRFAKRLLATAVARATRSGDVFSNQTELWKLVTSATKKVSRKAK